MYHSLLVFEIFSDFGVLSWETSLPSMVDELAGGGFVAGAVSAVYM